MLMGLFVFYIIGLFSDLPIIPWTVTDYFVDEGTKRLSEGQTLKSEGDSQLTFQVPNNFCEQKQCFDFWFNEDVSGNQLVKGFSIELISEEGDFIEPDGIYLFGTKNSRFDGIEITDFSLIEEDSSFQDNFRFIRVIFDLENHTNFKLSIDADVLKKMKDININQVLQVNKVSELTWNSLRFH